jgi:taurine dioxygenase
MDLAAAGRIGIRPFSPVIGAEVAPGDLRAASDEVIAQLIDAVHAHQVVFIRGQHLSPDDILALSWRLGRPMEPATAVFRDEPLVATFEITLERPPRADNWHTDISFYEAPPAFGLLSNVVAPETGGDTVFSSNHAAYEALSPPLQRWCRELSVIHSPGEGLRAYALRESGPEAARLIEETYPPRLQPLVIRHPHTGRLALYMSHAFIDGIAGLRPHESEALLKLLRAPYDNPNHQARWRWTPGDLAIWDQRAVNHRGLSDHFPAHPHRVMRSVFIADDIPIATLAAGRADAA